MFYFVGPYSELIFGNEGFELKQVLLSLMMNLYFVIKHLTFSNSTKENFKNYLMYL